ncbi:MAG: type IV pilus assembly protein PilM [Phycisphaerales bacterium]|nr:type IV pilus assembly protein PilM [Phycisphaerales bacterium]
MAGANACWGIEIGAHALKALKIERDGDNLRITDFAYIPHRKVLSTPDVDADDVTRLSIGALVSQYDLSKAAIAVSVPGHMAFARFAKLPPVEPKKIPDIVRFEAVQQIPFPIDEVVWDFQTFVSEASPDVEVGIFAITLERIEDRLRMWSEMGLDPHVVTLSPVAAYNALAYDDAFTETTPGVILLDIGTTSTDIIIAEEGRTWIRTFPIGGHQFTEQLAETFKLSYGKAEKLKRETSTSQYKRQILQAMRPIFADIVADVQQSIGYYQSLHPDANLTRIIGLGSTFQLPGMRKYLNQQLQIDVVRLDKFKRASLGAGDAARFTERIHNYATAYGLALQGLGGETIRANLMPKKVLRKQMWKDKTKWFATAAVVSVAASLSLFARPLIDGQAAGNNASQIEVTDAIRHAKGLDTQKREVREANSVGAKGQNMLALLRGNDVWPVIIDDITQALASADPQEELLSGRAELIEAIPLGERRLLWIESLQSSYAPPVDAEEGGRQTRGGRGMEGQEETAKQVNEDPLINVTLVVRTTNDEKQNFVNDTIIKWLRDNARRDGVPYVIDLETSPPSLRLETIEPGEQRTSTSPSSRRVQPGMGWQPSRVPGTSRPPPGRKTGRTDQDLVSRSEPPSPVALVPPDAVSYQVTITWTLMLYQPLQDPDALEMGDGA